MAPEARADPRLPRLGVWGEKFAQMGISPGASGNLSVRTDDGYLISRTGVELGAIESADWVEVVGMTTEDDGTLAVEYRGEHVPSRDAFVHGTVYARQPEARAVFHLHDSSVLGAAGPLGIPATNAYYPAGTPNSVHEIEGFLDRNPEIRYFVLVEHGIVAWGDDLDAVGELVVAQHRAAAERRG